jgi:hypothetical protein
MINISFNTFFKQNILGEKQKLTIILGSGFHKNAHGLSNYNCLTSWRCLLNEINPKVELSSNYLLDFERIVLNVTNSQDDKAAYKIDESLLKKTASKIKKIQNETISNEVVNYPLKIFNSKFVSDVISLNFDLIPELLLNNNKKAKIQNLHDYKKNKSIINSTRHRVVNGINFWHPHGDIEKFDSLILGTRKYGLHINKVEKLRNRSKNQMKSANYKKSWYDVLTHNPIIILGADISDMEWDLWSAFVSRERNFGKKENQKKYKFPIFQMRELNSKGCNTKSNKIWFNPLFDEKLSFKEQWNKLEKLLK